MRFSICRSVQCPTLSGNILVYALEAPGTASTVLDWLAGPTLPARPRALTPFPNRGRAQTIGKSAPNGPAAAVPACPLLDRLSSDPAQSPSLSHPGYWFSISLAQKSPGRCRGFEFAEDRKLYQYFATVRCSRRAQFRLGQKCLGALQIGPKAFDNTHTTSAPAYGDPISESRRGRNL
jgi:hypothetical protein